MFTSTPSLITLSNQMLRLLAIGYIGMAITQILSGTMRGAGDTVSPMWISLITTVVVRVPLAYLMAYMTRSEAYPHGQPYTLFLSMLISWISGAVITSIVFKRGKWKNKAIVKE